MKNQEQAAANTEQQAQEQGFMLLGLIVAMMLILLALSVAASKVAFSLKREREVEAVRRGQQYVRAIRVFYRKNNKQYPGSMEQLENTNNVRYLRQRYADPLAGNSDWKLIKVGQNKTQVKGFFGEPLQGIPSAGLGAAAGLQSAGVPSPTTGSNNGTNPPATTGTSTPSTFGTPISGAFMGVASSATGNSIVEWNGESTYETWEFLYDPRIELLIAKGMLNSGLGTANAGALGSGSSTDQTNPANPTNSINPLNPTSPPNPVNPLSPTAPQH